MAETFLLPAVGDTMVEGEIVEWLVAVGDVVELDQTICSLETDKSVVEMTTPYRGTVLQLGGAVGDTVEVGAPLLVVGEPHERLEVSSPPRLSNVDTRVAADTSPKSNKVTSPVLRKLASDNDLDVGSVPGTGPGGRVTRDDLLAAVAVDGDGPNAPVLAMPRVRRLAREQSVDLRSVNGSGPAGAITIPDLPIPDSASTVGQRSADSSGERRERMPAIRRSIAKHLTESAQQIPQFTSMVEFDATAILDTRSALKTRLDGPVPIDAVVMALMIPVLRENPIANAMLDGDEIVYFDRYDIGVAVDTPNGLMLPVVRGADTRSFADLSTEIVRLATAARDRSIAPDELSGATTTLNNVGALGVLAGTPILPLGTSTIVAFGKARPVLQLRSGNVVEVPTMTISATFDHRLIDGGDSGRFLQQIKQHLEVPALGLLR